MNVSTNTTFRIDAAMDVLLPRRRSAQMPRNRHQLNAIGMTDAVNVKSQRITNSFQG